MITYFNKYGDSQMKRIRSNKQQRYQACNELTRIYQGETVGQRDEFGNPLPNPDDTLRAFFGMGYYGFKWVKENIIVRYCDESNEVCSIDIDGVRLSYESPQYDALANRTCFCFVNSSLQ